MRKVSLLLIMSALLCLAGCPMGCPVGTPYDHSRAIGHSNMTFDVAPRDDLIAFNATGKGGRDLYLLDLSDVTVRRVAETDDYEVAPAFSPDGESLVFVAGIPGDRADHIFTVRLDGTNRTQLTSADANDTDPVYSPDGKLVAFARDKTYQWGGLASNWDDGGVICVVNVDGTNERQLTSDDEFAYSPQFSKDGTSIVYMTESGLYSMPLDGDETATRLGPGGTHVELSTDGDVVIFSDGNYSPDHEIFTSNLDGTRKTQITDSENGCFHPVFASIDDKVYFLMEEWPDGTSGYPKSSIWSATLAGDAPSQLTDLSLFDDPTNWEPRDGP